MANLPNFVFLGTPGNDVVDEGLRSLGFLVGNDILEGDDGDDTLKGFEGKDQIKGEVGNDYLDGGAGKDSLFGGVGYDQIYGGTGNDSIEGGANGDDIYGGDGADKIYGDNADPIPFLPSEDFFIEGNDYIYAGRGNDTVFGQGGDDVIFGEGGRDKLYGGEGNDFVDGGTANDVIKGNTGDDILLGDGGNDKIFGGSGNDVIEGGAGSDTLTGGAGYDIFVFDPATDFKNGYLDVITDFNVNQDRIDLSAFALGDGTTNFAYDDFEFGVTQGLESAFFQIGADTYLVARGELAYGLGQLGPVFDTTSGIKLEGVNIDDLGNANFIFPGE